MHTLNADGVSIKGCNFIYRRLLSQRLCDDDSHFRQTPSRVDALREVNAAVRGLSLEPLADKIDLTGIDWVIVGGESGARANVELFPVEWATELRDRCREEGVVFFLKQLGRRPSLRGIEFELRHPHGGDWSEWTPNLRVREMPEYFYDYAQQIVKS